MWEFIMGWTGVGTLAAVVAAVALFVGARASETRSAGRHKATQERLAGVEGQVAGVGDRLAGVEGRITGVEENVGTLTTAVVEGFEALKEQIGDLQHQAADHQAADEPETSHADITAENVIITDPDTTDPENVAATGPARRLPAGSMVTGSFTLAQPTRGARQVAGVTPARGPSGNP